MSGMVLVASWTANAGTFRLLRRESASRHETFRQHFPRKRKRQAWAENWYYQCNRGSGIGAAGEFWRREMQVAGIRRVVADEVENLRVVLRGVNAQPTRHV